MGNKTLNIHLYSLVGFPCLLSMTSLPIFSDAKYKRSSTQIQDHNIDTLHLVVGDWKVASPNATCTRASPIDITQNNLLAHNVQCAVARESYPSQLRH
ncbi:hypothetical protein BDR04DRAFT_1102488 [Suillus decipiens]|nr:hypothetical protein BDR04DRAFT_1102488 [Suillus decipiens]